MSERCWGKTTRTFRAEGSSLPGTLRLREQERSWARAPENELGHRGDREQGGSFLGTGQEGNREYWAQISRWRGRSSRRLQGRERQRENTENREDTYFLPLHPSILVPRLNLQLAQTQDSARSIPGKSGVHPQQGMQPPSHYPLGPAWPALPVRRGEGTSASQSVSLGPSLQLGEHGAAPTPLLGLGARLPSAWRLQLPAELQLQRQVPEARPPRRGPGPRGQQRRAQSGAAEGGASGNLNTAACSAFSTAAGREWGSRVRSSSRAHSSWRSPHRAPLPTARPQPVSPAQNFRAGRDVRNLCKADPSRRRVSQSLGGPPQPGLCLAFPRPQLPGISGFPMNKVESSQTNGVCVSQKRETRKNGTVRNMSICPTKIGFQHSGGKESFNGVSNLLVYTEQNSHPERQAVNRQNSQ